MKTNRSSLGGLLSGAMLLLGAASASAHIGYTGRDFGTIVPNAPPVTIANQAVTGSHGWADGTDADFGDGHKLRYYRFSLTAPAYVTVTFKGSVNDGTKDGSLKPGFSIFQGLAHQPPISNAAGGSADHDFSAITQAYLASLGGVPKEGAFRALADWRVGGDNQTGPAFDFDAADGLTTFIFKGYAVDGDASLFGSAPGVVGDRVADGTVTKSFYLLAGDYSIFVGGANYSGQFPTPDATSYGLEGSISASAFAYVQGDPAPGGITYQHQVTLDSNSSGGFSSHVGAWSWEDESLFSSGEPSVGWTHTSNWAAVRLQNDTILTVSMTRDATVPWPSAEDPDRKADTAAMFPSMTLYRGWDNDGEDSHSYNNRGNIAWAEDLQYVDHVDNSTQETITRTWVLPAGDYTIALGSNAPATNTNRQGFKVEFTTQAVAKTDPVAVAGGIGYGWSVVANAGETGSFSDHVGAWSWEDNALFSPGQPSVGWTHTSKWLALKLTSEVFFSLTLERDATVPWSGTGALDGKADTSSMFPSFTLYRGWDNDGTDLHTYNNRGNVIWAEDIRYVDHVDNSTATSVTRTWRLPAGEYSLALGSNAPANNTLRQGFKATYRTTVAAPVVSGDPAAGGIGYAHVVSVGRGDSGQLSNHVGAWSWEDDSLFDAGEGDPSVGWTHTSRWVALHVKETLTLNLTMSRDANVPWPLESQPDRKADTSSMFPSFTLWQGWDNDGTDSHSYSNRGNVSWAEDLTYFDHYDNSSQPTITRSYTLQPGYYTLALGSNAPATNSLRQGFSFAWSTAAASMVSPIITQHPKGADLVEGKKASFSVKATGAGVTYQWRLNGQAVAGGTSSSLTVDEVTAANAGDYTVEVRNPAGWVVSSVAVLSVTSVPEVEEFDIPDLTIGQPFELELAATNTPQRFTVKGLPRGLVFDSKTRRILGRPLVIGDAIAVEVTATNKAGTSTPKTDTFSVVALPSGVSGSFTGPIGRASAINSFLGGVAKLQVTGVGSVSGTVQLGSKIHKVAALLDTSLVSPTASINLPRPGQPALSLTLRVDAAAKAVYGTLTDGTTQLPLVARQPLSPAGAYAGDYTLAMLPEGADVGNISLPQGASIGAFKVAPAGAAAGVLVMADGSKSTFGGALEQHGNLTVFSVLYKGVGSILGVFNIQAPATVNEVSSTNGNLAVSELSWFKAPAAKDRTYGEGFGPLDVQVIGRKYEAPATGELALGTLPGPDNASLRFSHGDAPAPTSRLDVTTVEIGPKITKVAGANPGKVKLTITPGAPGKFVAGTAGSFKGGFELTDLDTVTTPNKSLKRTATFQGMLVDDGAGVKGYGFFLLPQMPTASPPTTAKTSAILSGTVMLEAATDIAQ